MFSTVCYVFPRKKKHRSCTPYRCSFKTDDYVNGRVSGLHCTWLVSRIRASFDDVDGFLTLRVDPLEEGCSTLRAWPNQLTLYGQRYNKPLNDTKELHVTYKMDIFIIVVTTKRALRSLVLYSIYIKYYFTLPIGECKDEGELIMMGSAR
ncbi:hypothetical protein M9H77_36044 [Catharanthus roseus]|uniref:Uncharacterized protein n=1 Tax=Catharanthus roseus TaxID=4058 RepID=A0ACB9ZSG4_CATRO|nr:hypothetical protein M9H77_36044 [Catharanthus roseus]